LTLFWGSDVTFSHQNQMAGMMILQQQQPPPQQENTFHQPPPLMPLVMDPFASFLGIGITTQDMLPPKVD